MAYFASRCPNKQTFDWELSKIELLDDTDKSMSKNGAENGSKWENKQESCL